MNEPELIPVAAVNAPGIAHRQALPMTLAEAIAFLDQAPYSGWCEFHDLPSGATLTLDGEFSLKELEALVVLLNNVKSPEVQAMIHGG